MPMMVSDYRLMQLAMVITYAVALLGLVLLTGFNGQISLGHGAIYALGAYATAISMGVFKVPYWLTPILSGALCFAFGYLFGRPALRLPGHLLALATFGLAMAAPQVLRYKGVEHWTGGVTGLMLEKPDAPFGLPVSADQWTYLFALVILLIAFLSIANLLDGRMGRAIVAVRDNPIAASAMGIDLSFVKTVTFGYSAMYTGVAGCLSALVVAYVAPDSFSVFLSITLLVGAVIGGLEPAQRRAARCLRDPVPPDGHRADHQVGVQRHLRRAADRRRLPRARAASPGCCVIFSGGVTRRRPAPTEKS